MLACLPAPAPLVSTVGRAVAFISKRVAPVAMPQVCLDADAPPGSGLCTVGQVIFPATDASIFEGAATTWAPDRLFIVMHEVIHQIAMNNGLQAGLQLRVEEGVSEAVAQDLKTEWMRLVRGRDAAVGLAYRDRVVRVRLASATATHTKWTSRAARRWRFALEATPPASRPPIPGIR